jgi:hypothetical protein
MPDEMSLPGIDPAPAAPATPAAPAPETGQGDTSTQSASVDTGAQAPAGDPSPPDPVVEAQKKESKGVQKRIDELVARERAADQRAERTEGLLRQVIEGVLTPQQARNQAPSQAEAAPNERDFGTWPEYQAALTRYEARQAVRSEFAQATQYQQAMQQRAQEAHRVQQMEVSKQQLHSIMGNQMQEAAARIPDYVDIVSNADTEVPVNVEAAMAISGAGGDVAYYLARNPHVIGQLARLPDLALATQVARIANAMRSGAYSVSNAPPPGRPAGSRGSGPADYPQNATPEQHMAWRNRQKPAAQR